jgi:aspartate aminotransferase-like enzyme
MREINSENKLMFVLGPTEIEDDILQLGCLPQVYMRTPDFSLRLENIFKNLQYLFQTKNPVVFFASSGTGAMEAAVTNLLSRNDSAIYVDGGSFGHRWGDICEKHFVNSIRLEVPFGSSINPQNIEKQLEQNKNIKAVFTTYDETSSGAKTDIEAIGKIVKKYPNTVLVVDAVSALLTEKLNMDEWGIDVVISSSQKALALPPGLGFMAISEKALKFAEQADLRTFYFDIFDYIANWKRNQTPFTPAVGLLYQLEKRLEKIKQEGLENIQQRYADLTAYLREGLKEVGFIPVAKNPVNCVTGIYTAPYDASQIVKIMREKYNIEIAPSGGDMKTKLIRVGNFGAIGKEEIDLFLKCLKLTLEELGCQK